MYNMGRIAEKCKELIEQVPKQAYRTLLEAADSETKKRLSLNFLIIRCRKWRFVFESTYTTGSKFGITPLEQILCSESTRIVKQNCRLRDLVPYLCTIQSTATRSPLLKLYRSWKPKIECMSLENYAIFHETAQPHSLRKKSHAYKLMSVRFYIHERFKKKIRRE